MQDLKIEDVQEDFRSAWDKMTDKLMSWFDTLIINLPNFIIALFVFFIVLILSKYTSKLFDRLLKKSKLQVSMKNLISRLASFVVICAGLFLILGILNLGTALKTVLAGAGVAGLAVGLALQGALTNIYSGIILSYVNFLKFGDWVESNGYEGEIVDIDLRSVTLKQADNNLVYLPNKMVVENPIKNYSTTAQSRVILNCGVAYSSDLRFVKELVINTIANEFEEVQSIHDIIFLWKEFGDSSINFETRFWLRSTSALEVAKARSEAIMLLKEAFDKNGITIPFPIRTLDIPENIKIEKITPGHVE